MALTFTKTETNYDQVSGVGFATHTISTGFDDIVITDANDKKLSEYTSIPPASIGVKYNTSAGGRSGISDYFQLRLYIDSTSLMWVSYDNMVQVSGGWQRKTIPLSANTNGLIPLNPQSGYSWGTYKASNFFDATNKTTASVPINVYAYSGRVSTGTYYNGGFNPSVAYASLSNELVGTINLRLNVPPTFNTTAISLDTTSAYANVTTASVTVSNTAAYYGGDVSSATLTIGQQSASISGDGTISIALDTAGTFTPVVSVTDSRGQVATQSLASLTVNSYSSPTVNFTADRTTSTGAPDDEGTYATLDATFVFSDVIASLIAPSVVLTDENGTQTTPTVTWYSSRAADGTLSGSVTWANLSTGDTVYGLVPGLNTNYSYQVSVRPRDNRTTGTAISQTVSSAFYTVDFLAGGHGIAFGKPASNVGFECAMDTTFDNPATFVDDADFGADVYIELPDYQTASTTDKAIYDAIVALGWDSDVLIP